MDPQTISADDCRLSVAELVPNILRADSDSGFEHCIVGFFLDTGYSGSRASRTVSD